LSSTESQEEDVDGFRWDAIGRDCGDDEFSSAFQRVADHRQAGKVDYLLPEVPLLILLAVLAGAETLTDIARFGERKIELLRRFRPYVNGTPSHDHLGDIFATLDARAFQLCFVAWVAALTNTPAEVIAIDGNWFVVLFRMVAIWRAIQNKTANFYVIEIAI
jgi:hypothetical protein